LARLQNLFVRQRCKSKLFLEIAVIIRKKKFDLFYAITIVKESFLIINDVVLKFITFEWDFKMFFNNQDNANKNVQ
jgi:hypothetical protein